MKPPPLWEVFPELVATAMGRVKADFVVQNATLIDVYSGELIEGVNVAIKRGRIASVSRVGSVAGGEVLEADGAYLAPGFLDGHVHVESSMLTPTGFAKAVLPRGTTGVFMDPHEIANVLGVEGVKLIIEESKRLPLRFFVLIPSCVPASTPELETSGAGVSVKDVEELLKLDEVVGLAEVMNYPGVLAGDNKLHGEIQASLRAGKVVDGHCIGLSDLELSAYVASGISSCHESTGLDEALGKVRLGMYVMAREGSAWRDLAEVLKVVTRMKVDPRRVILVTDDRSPKDLLTEGHVDFLVRRAIEEGVDPVTAIQMVTLNTAERFKVDGDLGGIAPGRYADLVLLRGLERVEVDTVIVNGEVVSRGGKLLVELKPPPLPERVRRTVKLKRFLTPDDFKVKASKDTGKVKVRVIRVIEGKALTEALVEPLPVKDGFITPGVEDGVAKVAVVERHGLTGGIGLGFVKGFNLKMGAVASTVAHDSHNLVVVGVNDGDMAAAVNRLVELGGGIIAVYNSKTIGLVELPVAGLMSDKDPEVVVKEVEGLEEAWRNLGSTVASPFMLMSLLALPVIPKLRITDKGLVLVEPEGAKLVSLEV
ncbi:MAG: adenine deaminase [Candidatus Nezhaarchaeales archaeon]